VPLTGTGNGEVAEVALFSPNGGEAIPSGSTYVISWGAPSQAVKFKLQYSMDNGATWETIERNLSGMNRNWKVRALQSNKRACLLKVTGYDASGVIVGTDKSDAPFAIEVVRLTAPNDPGISLIPRETYNITWTVNATKAPVETVELYYTKNATAIPVTWKPIVKFELNKYPGIYPWLVPSLPAMKTRCKVKVVLEDADGRTAGSDVSDSYFTIQPQEP